MTKRTLFLMRGLPACGKSTTARQVARDAGLVLETDQFFYTQVGTDPQQYDYDESLLPAARDWLFERMCEAISQGVTPIVLDRGNGLNSVTQRFARYAVDHGYHVELKEPDSPWWAELRVLLKYQAHLDPQVLDTWAQALASKSRSHHRVPAHVIRRWMIGWKVDLTVEEILEFKESKDIRQ